MITLATKKWPFLAPVMPDGVAGVAVGRGEDLHLVDLVGERRAEVVDRAQPPRASAAVG
ncbi:MAG: hypothetical protein U0802_21165 [Candidatus Binatia bacterium]